MKKDSEFYQAKYNYYKKIHLWIIAVAAISSIAYFFSDLYSFGHYTPVTLVPRFIIVVPLIIFIAIGNNVNNYKVMIPFSYAILHMIMWATIWACTKLPNLDFASDGFVIILSIFLAAGIAAPLTYGIIAQILLFVDILVANTFLHYPDFLMMFLIGIPFSIGIDLVLWGIEKTYVDQYQIRHQLTESAFHDQLTGMYNRNIMQKLTNPDMTFAPFYTGGLNIILMDIDFFKRVNDTYGHDKGDIVLKSVAHTVMSKLGENDQIIRWGGEEYIIFTPGSKKNAIALAENLRQSVENSDNGVCKVTISLGVAMYGGGDYNISVKHADDALYQAKESGRNRVVVYEE